MPPAASEDVGAKDDQGSSSAAPAISSPALIRRVTQNSQSATSTTTTTETGKSTATTESEPKKTPAILAMSNPYETRFWLFHLFIGEKFAWHRLGGMLFLLTYISSWAMYLRDYSAYINSPLWWALPTIGLFQSISATIYFGKILPNQQDPGYYSDNAALSRNFVFENIFFASILLWQFLYYSPLYNDTTMFASMYQLKGSVFELFFVFFPYVARPLFPKTSFRDSLKDGKNKTSGNYTFFWWGTWITKIFYVIAKHYIGFYLNYVRFAGFIEATHEQEMYRLLLFSSFATTISMFLHTLKFKGYIGPKTSFTIYMISYMCTFYSIFKMYDLFLLSWKLVAMTMVGVVLNFFPLWIGHTWQVVVAGVLYCARNGYYGIAL